MGFDAHSEISTNQGRIDLVITLKKRHYSFEFKFNQSASIALEQIYTRRYYEKYLDSSTDIILTGVSFTIADRKLSIDFATETLLTTDAVALNRSVTKIGQEI